MASEVQQQAREERREQIIDAAVDLFGQHGFRGTSVAAVADQVGVTDAGVLYHFGTKDELLLAVIDRIATQHTEAVEKVLGPAINKGGLSALRWIREWGTLMEAAPEETALLIVLSAEHLTDDSAVNVYFTKRYRSLIARLAEALDQAANNGEIRRDVDSVREASLFVAMLDGLRLQWFFLGSQRVSMADVVRDYVDNMIERLKA